MTQIQETRRHDDGSIDFGFYRAHAAQLRREQRSKMILSLLLLAVNRALTLMSRVDQQFRTVGAALDARQQSVVRLKAAQALAEKV